MTPSFLDRILSDIEVVNSKITIETATIKGNQAIFTTKSELGEGRIEIDDKSNIENLNEISIVTPSKATYGTELIAKMVKAVGTATCQTITVEYATNKPLRLTFALPNAVTIDFYLAPGVED